MKTDGGVNGGMDHEEHQTGAGLPEEDVRPKNTRQVWQAHREHRVTNAGKELVLHFTNTIHVDAEDAPIQQGEGPTRPRWTPTAGRAEHPKNAV
jgi:hypothetical protein